MATEQAMERARAVLDNIGNLESRLRRDIRNLNAQIALGHNVSQNTRDVAEATQGLETLKAPRANMTDQLALYGTSYNASLTFAPKLSTTMPIYRPGDAVDMIRIDAKTCAPVVGAKYIPTTVVSLNGNKLVVKVDFVDISRVLTWAGNDIWIFLGSTPYRLAKR